MFRRFAPPASLFGFGQVPAFVLFTSRAAAVLVQPRRRQFPWRSPLPVLPRVLGRVLVRTAVEGQQTQEPEDPNRPDNLRQPPPGDYGTHGRFDARAYSSSPQLWATEHRALVGVGLLAVLAAGVSAWFKRRG